MQSTFHHTNELRAGEVPVNASMMKQPSALLPMIMSTVALAIVLGHFAVFGIVREADEGTPAHLFQLLMALQVPLVAYFAVKWLPLDQGAALRVLALQAALGAAAFASVYFLT